MFGPQYFNCKHFLEKKRKMLKLKEIAAECLKILGNSAYMPHLGHIIAILGLYLHDLVLF